MVTRQIKTNKVTKTVFQNKAYKEKKMKLRWRGWIKQLFLLHSDLKGGELMTKITKVIL